MLRYLLDTGIVSAITDDPFGPVAARVSLIWPLGLRRTTATER